jgi:secondary thiamine-phosphate synthase enzyme
METFRVKTSRRTQLVDVTRQVEKAVEGAGAKDGVCYVFVPHTTAGVMINEHADPDVASDLEGILIGWFRTRGLIVMPRGIRTHT